MYRKSLLAATMALATSFGSGAYAASVDLGFIMDSSGSMNEGDYDTAMASLGSALTTSLTAVLNDPLNTDTYTVSIVSFASGAGTVYHGAINSGADLTAMNVAITAHTGNGNNTTGLTNYEAAFNHLAGLSGDGSISIVNMMTDGNDNQGNTAAGRAGLIADGWDSLSFESVGGGASNTALASLAFDTAATNVAQPIFNNAGQISDPLNASFVLAVASFGAAYDTAISTKVQKIFTPGGNVPIPGSLPLMASGLVLFGVMRARRKAA